MEFGSTVTVAGAVPDLALKTAPSSRFNPPWQAEPIPKNSLTRCTYKVNTEEPVIQLTRYPLKNTLQADPLFDTPRRYWERWQHRPQATITKNEGQNMQIGMIGLGRMGANMTRRLMRAGHDCVVFDVNPANVAALVAEGATGASDMDAFIAALAPPRAVWLMLPASITGKIARDIAGKLQAGDTIIDGGNSNYRDGIDLAGELEQQGIHFIDVGTSGGVFGLERGFCLMIGGPKPQVERLDPLFAALAPQTGAARDPQTGTAPQGYLHCGPAGSGHFVKMVHNGIEYGMMSALAEGLNILHAANAGTQQRTADAETAPLSNPHYYQYDLDLPAITEVWRHASVISSWLLDLTAGALQNDPALEHFAGRVSDSGEGRWTLQAAVETGVPAPVLSAALFQRFASRGNDEFAGKLLSAMRHAFGGHAEKKEGES